MISRYGASPGLFAPTPSGEAKSTGAPTLASVTPLFTLASLTHCCTRLVTSQLCQRPWLALSAVAGVPATVDGALFQLTWCGGAMIVVVRGALAVIGTLGWICTPVGPVASGV